MEIQDEEGVCMALGDTFSSFPLCTAVKQFRNPLVNTTDMFIWQMKGGIFQLLERNSYYWLIILSFPSRQSLQVTIPTLSTILVLIHFLCTQILKLLTMKANLYENPNLMNKFLPGIYTYYYFKQNNEVIGPQKKGKIM